MLIAWCYVSAIMEKKKQTRLSKALSHALRHDPGHYGLTLDSEGWVDINEVIRGLQAAHKDHSGRTVEDVMLVVRTSDKQRFEVEDGCIRARYGHSVQETVRQTVAMPPETLFHGTARRTITLIERDGLKPMKRQFVHLSDSRDLAEIVGKRRDKDPAILLVRAMEAVEQGVPFYNADKGVWLSGPIPADLISIQD